ncbi:MAG TPA: hypothetical protein RMH85_29640 [Polyangiaceae bacterium LLY-WYZ-15_(1-7)]|nr:hypothetical protein [Myxococcales bacterium]MAT23493.1 hypothetical protein [Sandaracinus sp.]HJK94891.1 hypothetical protein [Polyangiaceae bacterium LLY-WYZ-15_(1-7)]MBJ73239.1 hypothetical protein [Sandaracinus sp.]HJL02691.1 hypothetical protein [Polyangiaceae bacterium LLY-WYZ-15_(1-7)]
MRSLLTVALISLLAAPPAAAQQCAPGQAVGDPWPQNGIAIRPVDTTRSAVFRLRPEDGRAIRCALIYAVRRGRGTVAPELRGALRGTPSAPWVDESGWARIGAWYLQLEGDDEVLLSRTLSMTDRARIGLRATAVKRGGQWVVTSIDSVISHARR